MALPIVDARNGKLVSVGETVRYHDGDWWRLLGVHNQGLFEATAWVETPHGRQAVRLPIKYWARKLIYGPAYPSRATQGAGDGRGRSRRLGLTASVPACPGAASAGRVVIHVAGRQGA